MNPPVHRYDQSDSWFRRDSDPEHRLADSWDTDPLSGPDGLGDRVVEAREVSARHLAADDVPTTPRQHTERVPRYTGMSSQGPPPVAQASGPPAATGSPKRTRVQGTTVPGAAMGPAGQVSPGIDSPTMAQSAISPQGIPPSLAPMLAHEEQPAARHTGVVPGRGHQGPQPGAGPQPVRQAVSGVPPGVRAAVVLVTLLAAVPSVLLLHQALFLSDVISASGVIGGTLMLIGLPMFAAGLLPLVGGGAPAEGTWTPLRPPLLYLVAGVALLLAAGAAAG